MKARIYISGLAAGVPKTGFGVNLATFAYLEILPAGRPTMTARVYGIADTLSVGNESSTLLVGHVKTD
ncbi:hypothetical protein [Alkalilimnicola sp. S0819]|uniref:hypothetical protein n=1 Tax=Alkalilimnicola sp. S0819 TaxID=2613922 RepID=UPI001261E8F4|nr:hypothetical protein [Alkalilimnicola sp. S0819]KAB7624074.1 hypothetical protein F3N43_06705 [Alkalilimnicola sp. S0819]MPQ16324.1 hypothetical protein [Alkalilimnicola sp. S0819]